MIIRNHLALLAPTLTFVEIYLALLAPALTFVEIFLALLAPALAFVNNLVGRDATCRVYSVCGQVQVVQRISELSFSRARARKAVGMP